MNRKDFISLSLPLLGAVSAIGHPALRSPGDNNKIPPYLHEGDRIGITSPAGFITLEDIIPAKNKLQEWGYEVKVGETIGKREHTFGGTDEERRRDLQDMLDDPALKAIMIARGGYGGVRIIDQLDFDKFRKHPKWIIGFSDATLFHTHLQTNFGIASLHSKMCNSFPKYWDQAEPSQVQTINSIRECLAGIPMTYNCPPHANNRFGMVEAELVGGNLSLIENMAGTKSDLDTEGKILFLEEVDEYPYSIDRMLWNVARTGKLKKLKGLIIGGFNRLKPDVAGEEFGITVTDMVMEKVKNFKYPICFDFPVGHQKNNFALKCGIAHQLIVNESGVTLKSLA